MNNNTQIALSSETTDIIELRGGLIVVKYLPRKTNTLKKSVGLLEEGISFVDELTRC